MITPELETKLRAQLLLIEGDTPEARLRSLVGSVTRQVPLREPARLPAWEATSLKHQADQASEGDAVDGYNTGGHGYIEPCAEHRGQLGLLHELCPGSEAADAAAGGAEAAHSQSGDAGPPTPLGCPVIEAAILEEGARCLGAEAASAQGEEAADIAEGDLAGRGEEAVAEAEDAGTTTLEAPAAVMADMEADEVAGSFSEALRAEAGGEVPEILPVGVPSGGLCKGAAPTSRSAANGAGSGRRGAFSANIARAEREKEYARRDRPKWEEKLRRVKDGSLL